MIIGYIYLRWESLTKCVEQRPQMTWPQFLQWWRLFVRVNFWRHSRQHAVSESGIHTGAALRSPVLTDWIAWIQEFRSAGLSAKTVNDFWDDPMSNAVASPLPLLLGLAKKFVIVKHKEKMCPSYVYFKLN